MKVQTRRATMTNKERVEALLRREKPDRVSFWPNGGGFALLHYGYSLTDMYHKPEVTYELEKKACREFDWVFTPSVSSPLAMRGAFGGEVKLPTNKYAQAAFVARYAVETAEEAMALPMPDVKACIPSGMMDFYKRVFEDKDDNKPFVSFFAVGVRGFAGIVEQGTFCKWMIQKPEVAHHLCRLATDYELAMAQYFKSIFGVERVVPSGASPHDSNQLISPKHFEQFALPYYIEVHQKILAMGFKHISHHPCGEQNLNLPYWQQVPMGDPGMWRIGDEVDLATAAKCFPNDIIAGNLNTSIIQEGTPDEVYEAARKLIEKGKRLTTGFILTPACGLPPRAPAENMRAITRALNDFGWYD